MTPDELTALEAAAEAALDEELYNYQGDGTDTDFMSLFYMRCIPSGILSLLAERKKMLAVCEAAEDVGLWLIVDKDSQRLHDAIKEWKK